MFIQCVAFAFRAELSTSRGATGERVEQVVGEGAEADRRLPCTPDEGSTFKGEWLPQIKSWVPDGRAGTEAVTRGADQPLIHRISGLNGHLRLKSTVGLPYCN